MNLPIARTMSGQIAERIREKILNGEYAPGAPLLQDSIASEFGVSKIPVREALVHLRADGLVDIFAHRGFQVRALSAREATEVFRLRLQLEPEAVMVGARSAEEDDRQLAEHALRRLDTALEQRRLELVGDLNSAFHLSLIVPRTQPVASEILARLHTISRRYVQTHLLLAGRIRRAVREHNELYSVWASGNAREAGRLTRAHIEETRNELVKSLPD